MFGLTPYDRRNHVERGPFDPFGIRNFFEDFYNEGFFPMLYNRGGQMKVDIRETEKEYIVEAELPGVKKDEVNVDLNNDRLTISVERNEQINEEDKHYIRRERRYGSFARSFYVENVKSEEVSAKFTDGILTITLPKKEPGRERNSRIPIH
jgi:HSP20 family protein